MNESKIEFEIDEKKIISQCMNCPHYIDFPILMNNNKSKYGLQNYCSKMDLKLICFETEIRDSEGCWIKIPDVKECNVKDY